MAPTPSPIIRNGFEYYNDEFYALVLPNHRHRRSSIPELRAFFNSSSTKTSLKEKPAHWYRAQLIHYGLQPTDNKGTAAMRLLDALNRDLLEVPGSVKRVERELKKEYDAKRKSAKEKSVARSKVKGKASAGKMTAKSTAKSTAKKRLGGFADKNEVSGAASLAGRNAKKSEQSGVSTNVNVSINVGDLGGSRKSAKTKPTATVKREPAAAQEMDDWQSEVHYPDSFQGMVESYIVNTFNSDIILSLDNTIIWGWFQLGCAEGSERPWTVFYGGRGSCPFLWRARGP